MGMQRRSQLSAHAKTDTPDGCPIRLFKSKQDWATWLEKTIAMVLAFGFGWRRGIRGYGRSHTRKRSRLPCATGGSTDRKSLKVSRSGYRGLFRVRARACGRRSTERKR